MLRPESTDSYDPLFDSATATPGLIGRPVYAMTPNRRVPPPGVARPPKPTKTVRKFCFKKPPKPVDSSKLPQPSRDVPQESREVRKKVPLAPKETKW